MSELNEFREIKEESQLPFAQKNDRYYSHYQSEVSRNLAPKIHRKTVSGMILGVETGYWLQFDAEQRRFYGTPPTFQNQWYIINLTCFDKVDKASQFMVIVPLNNPPSLIPGEEEYANKHVVLRDSVSIYLPFIFYDPDKEPIFYSAWYCDTILRSCDSASAQFEQIDQSTDFWLKYQVQTNHLYGWPRPRIHIPYYPDVESFLQMLKIRIIVVDLAGASRKSEFLLVIENLKPRVSWPTIQFQFSS